MTGMAWWRSSQHDWHHSHDATLRVVISTQRDQSAVLAILNGKATRIMASLTELQTEVTAVSASIAAAVVALDDLAAKVGAGDPIAQADVDAITATLTGAQTSLDTAVATDDPPAVPPTV